MVRTFFLFSFSISFFFAQDLFAVTIEVLPDTVLQWENNCSFSDGLNILLSDPLGEVTISGKEEMRIENKIQCNGKLRISDEHGKIFLKGNIKASSVVLEAPTIILAENSLIEASCANEGGTVYVGGGWKGVDRKIQNAKNVEMRKGAQIIAEAVANGNGGTVVLWSELQTLFEGQILARGQGPSCSGGEVEVSSLGSLCFQGKVDLGGALSGHLLLDPISIVVQATNPDIDGNGTGLDITNVTQLDDAYTKPLGFPNANSVITAGALNALLTNNVSLTLAAQQFITVSAPITTASTNVTLTFSAPTVNLDSAVTLGSGGVVSGVGVNIVNIGPAGNVQNGIDIVAGGGTVNLATSTYLAPLNISNKNLTLNGNGQNNTTILVTGALPSYSSRNPAVYVTGGTNVVVQNLKVDCNNVGFPTNANICGIFYLNAGGAIINTHVTQVANSPPPYGGSQQGVAIRGIVSAGGPFALTIQNNLLDFFQKAAIVGAGTQLTANILNNTVVGQGVSTPSAIGIQYSGGTGTISGNNISNIIYADHASASGLLVFDTSPNLTVSQNTVTNSDLGIFLQNVSEGTTIANNNVQGSGDVGLIVYDATGTVQVLSNTLTNNGGISSDVNCSLYLFSSTNQTFDVANNSITPTVGTTAVFSQGQAAGQAPVIDLSNNTFIDPP